MKPFVIAVAATFVLAAPHAAAQWESVLHPSVPRTRAGEANLTAPAPKARQRKPDLSGVWLADAEPFPAEFGPAIEVGLRLSPYMINVFADVPAEEVPIQPWAQELLERRLQNNGKDDPVANCKPAGLPLLNALPLPLKIVQTQTLVIVLYEENAVFRQIFLDGRKPVEGPTPQALGYSTGRWDGNELVVETVGFSDRHWLDGLGHPLTEQMRLTERFRRPDVGHLEIETTVNDPGAYTRPFTFTVKHTLQPDGELLEYFCADNEKDVQHYQ